MKHYERRAVVVSELRHSCFSIHPQDAAQRRVRIESAVRYAENVLQKAERAAALAFGVKDRIVKRGELVIYHFDVIDAGVKGARAAVALAHEYLRGNPRDAVCAAFAPRMRLGAASGCKGF